MILHIYLLTWIIMIHPLKVKNQLSKSEEDSQFIMFEKIPFPKVGSIPILNRKIYKGTRVTIREHPYIVSIRRKVAHYTMGVLLTRSLVISVAHPLIRVPVHELKIVDGENYSDRGMLTNTVLLVIIHQHFDPNTLQADIALLRCHEYLKFRGAVKYIELIKPSTDIRRYLAHVTGWGRCDFTLDLNIGPGMICAGPARSEDPTAPCLAVPGAPLVIRGRLAGLQSWGYGCGYRQDLPLIYTSVKYYTQWIIGNLKLLESITKEQLSQFYQVTRAYELIEWLQLTRNGNVSHYAEEFDLQTVEVDTLLARLNGTLYDIRDYVYDRKFHIYKMILFKHLRDKYEKKASNSRRMSFQYKLVPFIDRNITEFNTIGLNDMDDEN